MNEIMDKLQEIMNMNEREKKKVREVIIKFCCYSDKTAKEFAEIIVKNLDDAT